MRVSISKEKMLKELPEVLLLAGILFWFVFILTTHVDVIDRGIVGTLGIFFFIGVGAMAASVLVSIWREKVGLTAYLATITTMLALYSLPWMISGTPFFIYSYRVLGYTNFIIDLGSYAQSSLPYQNWPGVMLVGSFLKLNTGISSLDLLYLFPIIGRGFQIITVGLLVKSLSGDVNKGLLAVLIYGMLDWTPYYMFEPQAMGMIFLLLVLWLTAMRGAEDRRSYGYVALFIIFICTMVISHVLSTFFCFAVILLLYFLEKKPYKAGWLHRKTTITFGMLLTFVVIFITYVIYANWDYLIRAMPGFLNSLGNLGYIFGGGSVGGSGGTSYASVILTKIAYLMILGVVGLTAFVYAASRMGMRNNFRLYFPMICLICAAAVTMTVFTSYRTEAVSRLFMLTMPFITVLCIYAWRNKYFRTALAALLIVSPFLFVSTAYGNMQMDYVSREEIIGVEFFLEYSPEDAKLNSLIERLALMERIDEWKWVKMTIDGDELNTSMENYPTYVVWSERDIDTANYNNMDINGTRLFEMENALTDNKVYSSSTYSIFQYVWW